MSYADNVQRADVIKVCEVMDILALCWLMEEDFWSRIDGSHIYAHFWNVMLNTHTYTLLVANQATWHSTR